MNFCQGMGIWEALATENTVNNFPSHNALHGTQIVSRWFKLYPKNYVTRCSKWSFVKCGYKTRYKRDQVDLIYTGKSFGYLCTRWHVNLPAIRLLKLILLFLCLMSRSILFKWQQTDLNSTRYLELDSNLFSHERGCRISQFCTTNSYCFYHKLMWSQL